MKLGEGQLMMIVLIVTSSMLIQVHEFQSETTFGTIKVSMLTHTYLYKPLREIKWPSAITRLTAHFARSLMSDLVTWKLRTSMTQNVLTEIRRH